MIIRTLIAAGAVLALAGPALAQSSSGSSASAPSASAQAPSGMTLQQFQAANGDKLFARLDTNKDGKITPEEFAAFREGNAKVDAQATKAGKRGQKLFSRFDADKDGSLSRAEADKVLAWRYKRMDTNNDGILTLEELQAKKGKAKVGV
jgi:Ca2+-binding EF-hand superfamily protein